MTEGPNKDMMQRRCRHVLHPTTYVNKVGICPQAHDCKEIGEEGCIIKGK